MSSNSTFSDEYSIDNSTNDATIHTKDDSEKKSRDDLMVKIESDYQLLKPRRKIIRAKIIAK